LQASFASYFRKRLSEENFLVCHYLKNDITYLLFMEVLPSLSAVACRWAESIVYGRHNQMSEIGNFKRDLYCPFHCHAVNAQ